ncbi:hypothetical protein HK099_000867, partial [Clydaea vesicula]
MLKELPSTFESNKLLSFGRGPVCISAFELAHESFERNAIRNPERIAVEHEGKSITYGELNKIAQSLSYKLVSEGVTVGDFVGIHTMRSIEMIVGIFGVLKAGAAYMIIDASLPKSRIEYILDISKCKAVLVHHKVGIDINNQENNLKTVLLDLSTPNEIKTPLTIMKPQGSDPAYVVFTSGSTGKPKGVVISHRSLTQYCNCSPNELHCTEGDIVAQTCSIGFDMCVTEVFITLSNSSTLVLREDTDFYSAARKANIIAITPTGLGNMNPEDYKHIKFISVGGEHCTQKLADKWASKTYLFNGYGPSEVTVTSSGVRLIEGKEVTIGYPLSNTMQYIVDKDLQLVPFGVAGELLIGGSGVALGYLNRPDLTAEKFIPNHFENDGSKMYKTGDICRWLKNGELQLLGRKDEMVKVKGYRIELDEVSATIAKCDGVSQVVTLVQDDNLVAYVTPETINVNILRESVSNVLPHYMCPAAYVFLDKFPLTTNQKVDKEKLKSLKSVIVIEKPQTETEKLVAQIWSELLKVDISKIGRHTSFFEIGGDSISAIQLVTKCNDIGLQFSTKDVFSKATLSQISLLKGTKVSALPELIISSSIVEEVKKNYCPEFSIEAGYDLFPASALQSVMVARTLQDSTSYLFQKVWKVSGEINHKSIESAFKSILIAYPTLRTRFVCNSAGVYQLLQPTDRVAEAKVAISEDFDLYCSEDYNRGFSMEEDFWMRMGLIKKNETVTHVVLTIHHVLYDGWCLDSIIEGLFSSYSGKKLEVGSSFKPVIQYFATLNASETQAFWSNYLLDIEPLTSFSLSSPKEKSELYIPVFLNTSASIGSLTKAAMEYGVTVALLAKAAWALTLKAYCQRDDIVFGFVHTGRDIPVPNVANIVGLMMNTIPCRTKLNKESTIQDWLRSLQSDQTEMTGHSHVGLTQIQKWISVQGTLFNSNFVFQNTPSEIDLSEAEKLPFELTSIEKDLDSVQNKFNEFDVQVAVTPASENWEIEFAYNETVLTYHSACAIAKYFDGVLSYLSSAEAKNGLLKEVPSTFDRESLLSFGSGEVYTVPYECAHHGFEKIAVDEPDRVAVEHEGKSLTYGELNQKSENLARELVSRGVKVGECVGILTVRSIEMIVSVFAVLKAGAAYMIIDAGLPQSRMEHIMEISKCQMVLVHPSIKFVSFSILDAVQSFHIDIYKSVNNASITLPKATGRDPAYAVFTSGSTGKPKG